jgi:prepilin-type N-terminal cleavage/methylation domain-containing protein
MINRTQQIGFTLPELMITAVIQGILAAKAAPFFISILEWDEIMHNKSEYNSGFTLMELMVTIAIAAILVGTAIPSFTSTITNNRLTTSANELVTALNLARSEAVNDLCR